MTDFNSSGSNASAYNNLYIVLYDHGCSYPQPFERNNLLEIVDKRLALQASNLQSDLQIVTRFTRIAQVLRIYGMGNMTGLPDLAAI